MRRPNWLLRYSISRWDQLPIFLVHEKTYSTTTVLNFWMGPAPYLSCPWEDLFDYCGTPFPDGTSSLLFSSMWRLIWLLRYSISGWDQLPIFLVHEKTYSTTTVLKPRMGRFPIFVVHETTTYSTTSVLDFRTGPTPYFFVHEMTTYSTTAVLLTLTNDHF